MSDPEPLDAEMLDMLYDIESQVSALRSQLDDLAGRLTDVLLLERSIG